MNKIYNILSFDYSTQKGILLFQSNLNLSTHAQWGDVEIAFSGMVFLIVKKMFRSRKNLYLEDYSAFVVFVPPSIT